MTADERRLLRVFRALSATRQVALLDYAEYLAGRELPDSPELPSAPWRFPVPHRRA